MKRFLFFILFSLVYFAGFGQTDVDSVSVVTPSEVVSQNTIGIDDSLFTIIGGEWRRLTVREFRDTVINVYAGSVVSDTADIANPLEGDLFVTPDSLALYSDKWVFWDRSNTDDQGVTNFSLGGTTLTLEIEDDGQPAHTVDLSSLQDGTGTDDQTLNYSGSGSLSIESGNTVDLSDLLDNTDGQTLSWVQGTGVLSISGGNNITISTMTGATSVADGEQGLVPKPLAGGESLFLRGDGTWSNPTTVDAGAQISDSLTALTGSLTSPFLPYWGESGFQDSPLEYLNDQSIGLPTGTTAQQPLAGRAGAFRFNTDNTAFEGDDGTSWRELAWADETIPPDPGGLTNNSLLWYDNNLLKSLPIRYDATDDVYYGVTGSLVFSEATSTATVNALDGTRILAVGGSTNGVNTSGNAESIILGGNIMSASTGRIYRSVLNGAVIGPASTAAVNMSRVLAVGQTMLRGTTGNHQNSALVGISLQNQGGYVENSNMIGSSLLSSSTYTRESNLVGSNIANGITGTARYLDIVGERIISNSSLPVNDNINLQYVRILGDFILDSLGGKSGLHERIDLFGEFQLRSTTQIADTRAWGYQVGRINIKEINHSDLFGWQALGFGTYKMGIDTSLSNVFAKGYQAFYNYESTNMDGSAAWGYKTGLGNEYENVWLFGNHVEANQNNQIVIGDVGGTPLSTGGGIEQVKLGNYPFNVDQDTTGKDGQVLTYNSSSGEIELQSKSGHNTFSTTTGTPSDTLVAKDRGVYKFDALTASGTQAIDVSGLATGDSFLFLCVNVDTNTMTVDIDDNSAAGGFIRHVTNGDFAADATESFTVNGTYKFIYDGTDLIIIDIN